MNRRVLLVDDEPRVLQGLRRLLRSQFEISTQECPEQALAHLAAAAAPYAAIVSDMRMPKMNGAEFLSLARKISPNSVRMMLTGNTDMTTAMDAVNRGEVFRFINKPCEAEIIGEALDSAIRQYELIVAEQDLLEKTLSGSIRVLTETLSFAQPELFGRIARVRQIAIALGMRSDNVEGWVLEAATSLSQLGCLGLPETLIHKLATGETLDSDEYGAWQKHPEAGVDMIKHIPRLDLVVDIIRYQNKWFNGNGFPKNKVARDEIPIGARILHACLAFDSRFMSGEFPKEAVSNMRAESGRFDPVILERLLEATLEVECIASWRVTTSELEIGMCLDEDVRSLSGVLLMCQGQEVTETVLTHLRRFESEGQLPETVLVHARSQSFTDAAKNSVVKEQAA